MAYAFNDDKSKFDLDTLAGNMATIEVSPTVNNHSTGEYILYDDVLYEVISPIAAGESLVIGTNIRSINIGDKLKSLRDSMSMTYVPISITKENATQSGASFAFIACGMMFIQVAITSSVNLPAGQAEFARIPLTYAPSNYVYSPSTKNNFGYIAPDGAICYINEQTVPAGTTVRVALFYPISL